MQEFLKSVSVEAGALAIATLAAIALALRSAAIGLINRGVKIAELKMDVEVQRLEAEKRSIAARAGVLIAEAAASPDSGARGVAKKVVAIEKAAELLDLPAAPEDLEGDVEAAHATELARGSLSPTPAETPAAKRAEQPPAPPVKSKFD